MSVDAAILGALRESPSGAVSGADLSQKLRISRAAIWARIEELRRLGYQIEASPHLGYRLVASPNLLHADDLHSRLGKTCVVGREIQVFNETTSTNDLVERLAHDGVREGIVVFAEAQSRGRGRLGRRWISPAGKGLWFSILLRPALRPQSVTQVTIATATALARAIRNETGLPAEIKWPNDILVNGKKVAGVLTELSAELDRVNFVVVGIGVDVNLLPEDFHPEFRGLATSLRIEAGKEIDRPSLATALLRELDTDYERVRQGDFEAVADEWENGCGTLGRQVSIRVGPHLVRGRAESLDADGALLVRTEHGRLERVVGGDVSLEK